MTTARPANRPALNPFHYISTEVRDTATIAREAGYHLARAGGRWGLEKIDEDLVFSGHAVHRAGALDTLSQVRYHVQNSLPAWH